jgi:hypothetical protein
VVAAFIWAVVVGTGLVVGSLAIAGDADQGLGAAPFKGRWEWHGGVRLIPALAFAGLVVFRGGRVTRHLRLRQLVPATGAAAVAWAVLLAAADGWGRVAATLESGFEYLPFAGSIGDPATFLSTFTDEIQHRGYPIHVKGHPPGMPLLLDRLDSAGLGGPGWAAALVLLLWGLGAAAVVVAVNELAGRERARQAAPFVALTPAAVWAGTSADALFAGVVAVGITLVVVATGRRGRRSALLALAGGIVLALGLHLTYGSAVLLLVPATVVVLRRRLDVLVPVAGGALAVTLGFAAAGFWWFDGLATTRDLYWMGIASDRPWPYHLLVGNPALLALALGPAVAVGLGHLDRQQVGSCALAVSALGAVVLADISGLSKSEVERIWLPFFVWITTAAAWIPVHRQQAWLGAQAVLGLSLQAWLVSSW